ncbi:hypothetical protein [Sphingomonas sp. PB1R3]|uniref:hypothetical protein n=1 Tax=Sphingomonas flavida TaxID=3096154 RepID=UPI002FC9000A
MAKANRSRDHHWWPVALQSYWCDDTGNLSWITPDGVVDKKKSANRKIGFKAHGHTLFRGHPWGQTNFESEFDVDNEIHRVVELLSNLRPSGEPRSRLETWLRSWLKKDRDLSESVAVHHIPDKSVRTILLLVFSLLIRAPSNRWKYENFPAQFGLPVDENVGKANMRQSYMIAKKLCLEGVTTNRAFVILHSDHKQFICGDGYLDLMTGSLQANRVNGRALLPLTPNACLYVCTPMSMRTDRNCYSLRAPPWLVDRMNEVTQVYSRDRLFFLGKKPRILPDFQAKKFLQYTDLDIDLIRHLDEIAQPKSRWSLVPFA